MSHCVIHPNLTTYILVRILSHLITDSSTRSFAENKTRDGGNICHHHRYLEWVQVDELSLLNSDI